MPTCELVSRSEQTNHLQTKISLLGHFIWVSVLLLKSANNCGILCLPLCTCTHTANVVPPSLPPHHKNIVPTAASACQHARIPTDIHKRPLTSMRKNMLMYTSTRAHARTHTHTHAHAHAHTHANTNTHTHTQSDEGLQPLAASDRVPTSSARVNSSGNFL